MRSLKVVLLFFFLLRPFESLGSQSELEVLATPIELTSNDYFQSEIGDLYWLGGLQLSADHSAFGGFSGLLIEEQGKKLIAVSDRGYWLSAEITYDSRGKATGLQSARMTPVKDGAGKTPSGKADQDSEALARLADGTIAIAFERRHRLQSYKDIESPGQKIEAPAALADLPKNLGIEALTLLADGRLLAISENRSSEVHRAFLRDGKNWGELQIQAVDGHRPTGATSLPNGDILLVERRFTPPLNLSIRIRRVAFDEIRPGARILGKEVAQLSLIPSVAIDNMEGIAAWRSPEGKTLVALISDDNFNPFQRSLLLFFELKE